MSREPRVYSIISVTALAILSLATWGQSFADEIAPAQGSTRCERSCLINFVDRYLDALVANDPGRMPLSSDVKFTENTIRLNLGESLWETATGLGDFRIYSADVYSGQAGFMGVILERGEPRMLALRLRIKNDEISEIETIVTRRGLTGPFEPEMAMREARSVWAEPVDGNERVSRLELLTITDLYFEGMEQGTGEIVPFDESCNRTENGLQTTNNPSLDPPAGSDGPNFLAMGCEEQFNSGGVGVFRTPERRIWMVDEELGLVYGLFVFTTVGGSSAIPIAELFKIKNGRIYEVEAAGVSDPLPHRARSGW